MLIDSRCVRASQLPWIFLQLLSSSHPVAAAENPRPDPQPEAREAARLHYAEGLELAGQANYEAALHAFTEAYTLSPHFAVLYNIGQAQVALGRPVEAAETLSKYLREGQDQVPPARRQQVVAQIALLQSLFAELAITTDRSGALISIDGREVGRTPLYQPLRLAAGRHTVAAALEGAVPVESAVTLDPGERQFMNLELRPLPTDAPEATEARPATVPMAPTAPTVALRAGAPRAVSAASGAAPTATEQSPPPMIHELPRPAPGTPNRSRRLSPVGYAAASAGVVLGGAALVVYLRNRGRYQTWQDNRSSLERDMGAIDYHPRQIANNQLADSLTRDNHLIAGLSVAGGALLAGGLTLLIVDRIRAGAEDTRPRSSSTISFGWDGRGPSSGNVSWSSPW